MKMKSIIVCFTFLIYCSIKVFSQQLPEVPIKDGHIYYELSGKLNNKKNCILQTDVIFTTLCNQNLTQGGGTVYEKTGKTELINYRLKKSSFTVVNEKENKFIFRGGQLPDKNFRQKKLKCNDTLTDYPLIIQYEKGLNYFDRHIINFLLKGYKSKITDIELNGDVMFIFPSFNEIHLKIRRFVIKFYFQDGSIKLQDLSEYYFELKKKSEINKNETKLFNDLNLLMNHFNKVLIEKMNDEIQYLEMD